MSRFDIIKQCVGKRKYREYEHADRVLARMSNPDGRLHIYWCVFCNRYHIGHGDRKESVG